jgi:release factor glutamine methyltransferase
LAKSLACASVDASDVSGRALTIAEENAKRNQADIHFMHGDLFANLGAPSARYHVIVSNPPYIATQELERLQPEVQYEPRIALDGGLDGVDFYRRLIACAPRYLEENGFLALEIGHHQKAAVEAILKEKGNFTIIDVIRDYHNIERVLIARRTDSSGERLENGQAYH